jgi:hypothetical protein
MHGHVWRGISIVSPQPLQLVEARFSVASGGIVSTLHMGGPRVATRYIPRVIRVRAQVDVSVRGEVKGGLGLNHNWARVSIHVATFRAPALSMCCKH